MTRHVLVLILWLGACGLAAAQTYHTRAELKKPLSEKVEQALAEFIEQCGPEKQKQLAAHMAEVIQAIDEQAKLNAEEKAALEAAAEKAVERAVDAWKPTATLAMRTYLSRTSETAAARHVSSWKPEVAAPNEPVEGWTPPQEDAQWLATLRTTLGEERFKAWSDADAKAGKALRKEIDSYLTRWGGEARGPMNEDLQTKIGQMKTSLKLDETQVKALEQAADELLGRLVNAEKKRAADMLRTMMPAARRNIMGRSYFYVRFDRPRGESWDKLWRDAAARVLTAPQISQWIEVEKAERAKLQAELEDMMRPSELQARQQMENTLNAEIDTMTTALNLDKERQKALEQLSKAAVEESLKQARTGWLQQARNYTATERKRVAGNVYFGISEEQAAGALPVWKDGLKKILSEAELNHLTTDTEQRTQRTTRALACACLAEMDKTLALNQAQREKLEPLLMEAMGPLLAQRNQQYWSYNPVQLFQRAGKMDEKVVRSVLDEKQHARWQELVQTTGGASRNVIPKEATSRQASDMEVEIAAHLYKLFMTERKRVFDSMMPLVEDAQRVLSLPPDVVARLTTAAKGAVEQSLGVWRQNTERYVRQTVQTATPKNILQALAATERVSFGRMESNAQQSALWQTALSTSLDGEQRKRLKVVTDARLDYRLKAMAAMSVSELDRRRRLSGEQCGKLQDAVKTVVGEYLPDIERYMSFQWFLQYYYALVPLAGVPEKEMQAILTPEQWKLCKDRDLPDAMQYWEGIKTNHDNRVKQGANAGQVLLPEE